MDTGDGTPSAREAVSCSGYGLIAKAFRSKSEWTSGTVLSRHVRELAVDVSQVRAAAVVEAGALGGAHALGRVLQDPHPAVRRAATGVRPAPRNPAQGQSSSGRFGSCLITVFKLSCLKLFFEKV